MRTVLRTIAGVVVGLILAFALIVAVEAFSAVVHPLPEDFDGSMEEMCRHVERYPHWVLAVVVPEWAATALVGVWVARRIGNLVSAALVGLLLLAGLVFNVSILPYPIWFKFAILVAVPAAVLLGIRWSRPRAAAPQPSGRTPGNPPEDTAS